MRVSQTFVLLYTAAVIDGDRTFESIPESVQPYVRDELIKQGLGELAGESAAEETPQEGV